MVLQDPNVGVAFGLALGAGAATSLGASVVFFPSLVKLASHRVLAGALGVSAGVMLYVSFIEVFQKTMGYFEEDQNTPEIAFAYATCCFFGGVVFMMLMDKFIHWLGDCHQRRRQKNLDTEEESCHLELGPCACPDHDPIAELEQWQAYVVEQQQEQDMTEEVTETAHGSSSDDDDEEQEVNLEDVEKGLTTSTTTKETYAHSPGYYHDDDTNRLSDEVEKGLTASTTTKETHIHSGECSRDNDLNCLSEEALKKSIQEKEKENNKLVHMGLSTAVAIGLHNFPEGLAAFVAALGDVRVGFVFALAIAIHNIPEGLCVALPIYYGTGSRWKAFGWACISGVSEPLGALLGWMILVNHFTPTVYAILFGIVAGMMVFIVIKELLPTAHRYDPDDTVVTYCIIAGMAIMGLSLVLFAL